ncbi:hypothetical protein IQ266_04520 [filamentous cyanobacterium LEGE 11480]|uniref:Uncharacterized protein n=1 Tax=Romeriopsis navalis LEGE 11480 TaxID=2777977 RepID=A0A928VIM6_9CYAN|nr:hypothetical protein [Romeriopsis navalis]MBE9029025.1 hypothetical protein [Romeriopsis navalis LEGE 11480]
MKRQLMALCLLGLTGGSLLGTIAPAAAGVRSIQEKEPNFPKAAAVTPIYAADDAVSFAGAMTGNDREDIHAFRMNRKDAQFSLNYFGSGSRNISLSLYEDTNKNGQFDASDKFLLRARPAKIRFVNTSAGTNYLLRATKSQNAGGRYVVTIAKPLRVVSLSVLSAKALTKFDRKVPFTKKHRADFFVNVRTGGKSVITTKRIKDNDNPRFTKATHSQITDQPQVTYDIRLKDSDPGRDDQADISPTGARTLRIRYSPITNEVFGPNGKRIGFGGRTITMRGNARKNRASISFRLRTTLPPVIR